jgi:hypothetical protein
MEETKKYLTSEEMIHYMETHTDYKGDTLWKPKKKQKK